jgi:hypothetical protein
MLMRPGNSGSSLGVVTLTLAAMDRGRGGGENGAVGAGLAGGR